jgi:hypothetical protein
MPGGWQELDHDGPAVGKKTFGPHCQESNTNRKILQSSKSNSLSRLVSPHVSFMA